MTSLRALRHVGFSAIVWKMSNYQLLKSAAEEKTRLALEAYEKAETEESAKLKTYALKLDAMQACEDLRRSRAAAKIAELKSRYDAARAHGASWGGNGDIA